MHKSKLAVAVIGAFMAMSAEAGTYVVQAAKWGAAQQAAVQQAGGTIIFASPKAGIAVVESANDGFLAAVRGSGAVQMAVADVALQYKMPVTRALDPAYDPASETFGSIQWNIHAVEAPAAWDAGFTGNGVRVAVLDGGVNNTHVDLAGQVDEARSRSFATGNACAAAYNCDTGTFWHGTHVSGIIAAKANGIGTVGIAPEATIVAVKSLHGGTGSFGWVISAILYAATPIAEGGAGANIINMSLGADVPRNAEGVAELMSVLNRAVNFASAQGVVSIVAAGNDGMDMDATGNLITVPAESGNAIAVSATGPLGFALGATDYRRPASYSNYGNSMVWVSGPGGDFALPGDDVCAYVRSNGTVSLQFCWVLDMVIAPGGASNTGYSWAAGTSMAAPAAAAVAALIKQKHPGANAAQLKTRLAQSADDEGKVGQDGFHGNGFVNARRAATQ